MASPLFAADWTQWRGNNAKDLDLDRLCAIFESCVQIAKADGNFTKRETRVLDRIQELIPNLQLQLIAEHHPEAAKRRDFQTTAAKQTVGELTPGKIFGWLLFIVVAIGMVVSAVERAEFRRKFDRIRAGTMTREEVVDLLGKPVNERGREIKTQIRPSKKNGFQRSMEVHTETEMIWGKSYPRYTDEYRYTVNLRDGMVTSKDVKRGTDRRDYN